MTRLDEILTRIYHALGFIRSSQFCEKYDIKANTLSTWKKRNKIPYELIEEISQNENLSLDWLLTGKGEMLLSDEKTPPSTQKTDSNLSDEEQELITAYKTLPDGKKRLYYLKILGDAQELIEEQEDLKRKKHQNNTLQAPSQTSATA